MRIAVEGQRLFRAKKHGMDFVALELIKNLMEIDKTNEYVIFVAPGPDKCLSDTENFTIVEIRSMSYPVWEQVLLPFYVRKYKCDLLHSTSNTAPILPGVPLVLTLHDIIYLESGWLFKKGVSNYQRFGNLYRKTIVPSVMKRSSKTITVSEFERERIINHFGLKRSDGKVETVYNGVGSHFTEITNENILSATRIKYNLPERYILHLGNRDPKKNTEGVLRAYRLYLKKSRVKLPLVITDLGAEELKEMQSAGTERSLESSIITPGYIPNSDLPAVYSMAETFLYPSLRESFGIPILEAMKCGVPVITSDTSSMPEISGEAALLADPYDPSSIASALLEITEDRRMHARFVTKGLERAGRFSWFLMAEQVAGIYSQLKAEIGNRSKDTLIGKGVVHAIETI